MNLKRLIFLFHYGTGLMDAITGLGLIFIPTRTLSMMGVAPRVDVTLVSYIGIFVFAVGVSHFLAGGFPNNPVTRERWKMIWKISALVRLCVGSFVLVKIITGQLDTPWIAVTATDLSVALVFLILLERRALNSP